VGLIWISHQRPIFTVVYFHYSNKLSTEEKNMNSFFKQDGALAQKGHF